MAYETIALRSVNLFGSSGSNSRHINIIYLSSSYIQTHFKVNQKLDASFSTNLFVFELTPICNAL